MASFDSTFLTGVDDVGVSSHEASSGLSSTHLTQHAHNGAVTEDAGQLSEDFDRVSQITRHHKVLREMKAMDDQLFTMKQDFANRLRVVRQGEARYMEKQKHTVEYLAKFKSYIVETDTKRLRAERKEEDERKCIENIQLEGKKLREEIQRKKRKLREQKRKVNHFRKYKMYLEMVLQATSPTAASAAAASSSSQGDTTSSTALVPSSSSSSSSSTSLVAHHLHHHYNDVEELLVRYANLTSNNTDLQQRVTELQQQISAVQSQRQALRKERQNEILVNNSVLAKMMKDLETETALVTELTLAADLADRERLDRSQLLGNVDMAIDNLYEKACRIVKRGKSTDPIVGPNNGSIKANRIKSDSANQTRSTIKMKAMPLLVNPSAGTVGTPLLLGPDSSTQLLRDGMNTLMISENEENRIMDPTAAAAAAAAAAAEDRRIFAIFEQQNKPPSRYNDIQSTLKLYSVKLSKIQEALSTLYKISEVCRHGGFSSNIGPVSGSNAISHIQSTAKPRNLLGAFGSFAGGLLVGPSAASMSSVKESSSGNPASQGAGANSGMVNSTSGSNLSGASWNMSVSNLANLQTGHSVSNTGLWATPSQTNLALFQNNFNIDAMNSFLPHHSTSFVNRPGDGGAFNTSATGNVIMRAGPSFKREAGLKVKDKSRVGSAHAGTLNRNDKGSATSKGKTGETTRTHSARTINRSTALAKPRVPDKLPQIKSTER